MKHGVVVSPTISAKGKDFKLDCTLDAQETRRHLLYWDQIAYAYPNGLGKPNLDSLLDISFLHEAGVLSLIDIDVSSTDIGKPDIPNPTKMEKVKSLFVVGNPTPDNMSGLSVLDVPASIWPDLNDFAQLKAVSKLQSSSVDTWTMSQSSSSLHLPYGSRENITLFEANLYAGLPVPSSETPLNEILEFKEKRKSQLLKFRHAIDSLYLKMKASPDHQRELRKASEELDLAIIELTRCLEERNIQTFFTTLGLYLNIQDSKLLSTLLGIYGSSVIGVPLEVGAALGLGVNTVITFATRCIKKPVSVPNELQDFMYLYEVKKYWPRK